MDRRHRPFLGLPGWLRVGLAAAALPCAGSLLAQDPPTPGASPAVSATPSVAATPWVEASPPPAPPPRAPKPPRPPKPAPAAPDDTKQEMIRRRMDEKRAAGEGVRMPPPAGPLPVRPDGRPLGPRAMMRLEQLPPEERAAYQRNLAVWNQLPAEEREVMRRQFVERSRQETDKAYQESGLSLDNDQREIFNLRYRQERRKLERELQEKINAERQHRLGEITARLKTEFGGKSTTPASPTPSATP